ncbi:hypothetical protein [Streptomyces sp. NPDC050485]|uniref:hypothetical protein n=1 Tax=Streptomyces sp. NPDC050485 TaxID=3365617 RepID=UPI0037A6D23B
MTYMEAAAALEDARFDQREDTRREDLDTDRLNSRSGNASRALLDGTADVYHPDADDVVQDELVADATAADERGLEVQCGVPVRRDRVVAGLGRQANVQGRREPI